MVGTRIGGRKHPRRNHLIWFQQVGEQLGRYEARESRPGGLGNDSWRTLLKIGPNRIFYIDLIEAPPFRGIAPDVCSLGLREGFSGKEGHLSRSLEEGDR